MTTITVELTLVEASLLTLAADLAGRIGYYVNAEGQPQELTERGKADLAQARRVIEDAALPVLKAEYPDIAARAAAKFARSDEVSTGTIKTMPVPSRREPEHPTGLYL